MRNQTQVEPASELAFATIRSAAALLRVPAATAYEREIALEHALHCARRYGSARLELDGCCWLLRRDERGHIVVCGKRTNGHTAGAVRDAASPH